CDALTCAFEALAFGSTGMCGRATFWFWVIAAVPFYFATWEQYISMFLKCFLLLGAEWWAQDFRKSIPLVGWMPVAHEIPTYGVVLFILIVFGVFPTISSKSYLSPSDVMRNHPHLLIVGTGFAFGFLVGRMILAHLCDEPKGLKTGMCMVHLSLKLWLNLCQQSLLFLPLAIANALTARLNDGYVLQLLSLMNISFLLCIACLQDNQERSLRKRFRRAVLSARHYC
ncbi:hypothetical protein GW17_00043306, partial [Ensete ventricosum]